VASLLGALSILYLLQHQQYAEYAAKQNYRLGRQIDTLNFIIQDLDERLSRAEKANHVSQYRLPDRILFCDDTLDLHSTLLRERNEREFYSLLSEHGQIQLYLKRSLRYLPMIENKLALVGLPVDLKYVAIHESALLPDIRSRANAVGLWQFMRGTGRLYRLKINRYVDERRDPEKSTEAAIRMLRDLYRKFGDWQLVLAAYNGGVNRIHRNIREQQTDEFIALTLPDETERYYFKIVATKLILENPVAYGFYIDEADYFYTPPIKAVDFTIHSSRMSLNELAELTGMELPAFKYLNPQFIHAFLPDGTYKVYIPESSYSRLVINADTDSDFNFKAEAEGQTGERMGR